MLQCRPLQTLHENYQGDIDQLTVKYIRLLKKVFESDFENFFRDHPAVAALDWQIAEGGAVLALDFENDLWYTFGTWRFDEVDAIQRFFAIDRIYVTNFEAKCVVQFFDQNGRRLP